MSSQPKDTRTALLDAAWSLVEETSSMELRMADVAGRAGVSRQALYLHFGNRTGLLLALVDHIDRTLGLPERLAEVAAVADPVERLLANTRLTARYAGRIDRLSRLLDRVRDDDPAAAAAWEDRMAMRRAGIQAIVAEVARDRRLADGWTAERAADAIWALSEPRSYRDLVGERGWSEEAYEGLLVDVVRAVFVHR